MDNQQMQKQIDSLEIRLSKIEKMLDPPTSQNRNRSVENNNTQEPLTPTPTPTPKIVGRTEDETSGNWLGLIAVICFVLAAGFIVKLSISSGWLTPARQIGLSILLGISLILTGLAGFKSDRGYASFLPAAGIIILFLSVFGGARFYEVISLNLALLYITIISGACIWLYTIVKHDFYPITAAIGTYLSPILSSIQWGHTCTQKYQAPP